MSVAWDFLKGKADSAERISDAGEIDRLYRYWRLRILATSIFGYALFYFVRVNLANAQPDMGAKLHLSHEQLGEILTVGGLTYGVSKFLNGFVGDHANPRYFMALGLAICAAMNFAFGASSTLTMLLLFWFLNNFAQGMGFPPCARSMAYWFSPRERSSTFGIWHTSHMIGAALVGALTGYLVNYYGWRSCFYIPATLASGAAILVLIFLRDTPGSMGLPPVEIYKNEESPRELAAEIKPAESYWHIVVEYIFKNPSMWIISLANLLVYTLRSMQLFWGPTFLQDTYGMSKVASGWLYSGSEMSGMVGALLAGFITDRIFGGRAGRVCMIAMTLMIGVIYLFGHSPSHSKVMGGALYMAMGFLVYVPQMLIAAMAMNLGTKRASAAAVGMTGIFGYLSTAVSGWGVGSIVDKAGWGAAFTLMIGCAAGTVILLAFTWNVGAHPELPEQA